VIKASCQRYQAVTATVTSLTDCCTDLENQKFMLEFSVKQFQLGSFCLKAGDFLLLSDQQQPQLTNTVVILSAQ